MKKWFIADTRFSPANIIKYAGRPFASVVGDDDQVFFLGDKGKNGCGPLIHRYLGENSRLKY